MFQVSLSTFLTPPAAPGAALPAALSGDFSATLAGLATTRGIPADPGKTTAMPRQASAEAGKTLPIEGGESIVLPASADAWLDPVAILASPSAQPIALKSDTAGPILTPKADQAPKHGETVSLPIVNDPQQAADPIIIGTIIPPLRGNEDKFASKPAGPKSSDQAEKKATGAASVADPQTIPVALPIALPPTPAQAVAGNTVTAAPGTSAPSATPSVAMPAPPPSGVDAPGSTISSDSQASATAAPGINAQTREATLATTEPAMPAGTIPAAADGSAARIATSSEAPMPLENRDAKSIALAPGKAPARSQDEPAGRSAAAVKVVRRGDVGASTVNMVGRPVISGATGSNGAAIDQASLQQAAAPASSGIDKPSSVAPPGSAQSGGDTTTAPASTSASIPDAVVRDKAPQPTTIDAAPPASSRVATVNAAPAANTIAATPPQLAAAALPAGMLFGIALDQRAASADRPSPRAEALQALSALAGAGSAGPVVAAAGGVQHNALDMRRDDWPQAMIDRIEALRDAADATSTRITLMPDALGKVDVSLRHDGDTVHVHFAADTAQARTMLADAQPRLADAAQARGIRLGQTSVGAGGGEAGRQPPRQPSSPMPSRPVSATLASADAASDSSRLA